MSWSWPEPAQSPRGASGSPRWRNHHRRTRRRATIINRFQVITITLSHTKCTLIHPNKNDHLNYTTNPKSRAIEGVCVCVGMRASRVEHPPPLFFIFFFHYCTANVHSSPINWVTIGTPRIARSASSSSAAGWPPHNYDTP